MEGRKIYVVGLSFTCQVRWQAAGTTHKERDVTTSLQGPLIKTDVRRKVVCHGKSEMYCVTMVWSFFKFSIDVMGGEFCSQFSNQRISSKIKKPCDATEGCVSRFIHSPPPLYTHNSLPLLGSYLSPLDIRRSIHPPQNAHLI